MKIRYIDGKRLYYAVIAGGNAVINDQAYLNKINVFPVADADTGTNLTSTMQAIARRARAFRSPRETLSSIADAALVGARGNSGLIFAQFLLGLSREIKHDIKVSTHQFADAARQAVYHARQAVVSPAEGTILSVMHDWGEAVYRERLRLDDFVELLLHSLNEAESSLKRTTEKLSVLARAGVVDAGARGFYDFIQGIAIFIRKGNLKNALKQAAMETVETLKTIEVHDRPTKRFCTEALIKGQALDSAAIRQRAERHGESVVIAGDEKKIRVHLHTDRPADFFASLESFGRIVEVKADDMKRQFEAVHSRIGPTAILTDSTCDLPEDILNKYQIHVVPFSLSFGNDIYIDKVTIEPDRFYEKLRHSDELPRTGQPSPEALRKQVAFLAEHYESVLAITISGKLSGIYGQLKQLSHASFPGKIAVVDSRHLSVSLALIVMRAAEAVAGGKLETEKIADQAAGWAARTSLFVDIRTLKYMVRGGRVSRLKGLLASALNIKPIISLDEQGQASVLGKSFSRRGNMKKILNMIAEETAGRRVWNYAIVHAMNIDRARRYAEKLESITGKPAAFINEISPAVGVHNGIGVVGIAVMYE